MKPFLKRTTVVVALCLLGATLGYATSRITTAQKPAAAPSVSFITLEGQKVSLEDWKGKLLLVNFWATWCAPCRKEMPILIDAQKRYGARGLQIIGPALDEAEAVRGLATKLKINYPLMVDDGKIESAMFLMGNSAGGLPFSVLIDPQGRIVRTVLGDMSAAELDRLINAHLPDPQTAEK